jgi:hypothetical protein
MVIDLSGAIRMTTWVRAVVIAGRAESFHGDILVASSWYNIYS